MPLPPHQKQSFIPTPHHPPVLFCGDLHLNRNVKHGALTGMSGAEYNDAIVAHQTTQPVSGLSVQSCAHSEISNQNV